MSVGKIIESNYFNTAKRVTLLIAIITVLVVPVKYSVFKGVNISYIDVDTELYENATNKFIIEKYLINGKNDLHVKKNSKKPNLVIIKPKEDDDIETVPKEEKNLKLNSGYTIEQNNDIKNEPFYDKYGINLYEYITDDMVNIVFNNNTMATVEDLEFYTPPCPNLQPLHYPDDILNPVCENHVLPLVRVKENSNNPYILRLQDITSQMKKWQYWQDNDGIIPNYKDIAIEDIVNDEYHPFDYGYYDLKPNKDDDYYTKVIKSPLNEVPDPRRRRLFSMILFNFEFELLDLYLSEYYEIVDYFIIFELNSTFSGDEKPYYLTKTLFETNRYEKFKDKIIPITVPVHDTIYSNPKEFLARKQVIEKGLKAVHAHHGDLFFQGDLEEIPKARLLSYLKKCGGWEHLQMGIGGGPKSNTKNNDIQEKSFPIAKNEMNQNEMDYSMNRSLLFNGFFYEYSFNKPNRTEDFGFPELFIYDARRSLDEYLDHPFTDQELNAKENSDIEDVTNYVKRHAINKDKNTSTNKDDKKGHDDLVDIDDKSYSELIDEEGIPINTEDNNSIKINYEQDHDELIDDEGIPIDDEGIDQDSDDMIENQKKDDSIQYKEVKNRKIAYILDDINDQIFSIDEEEINNDIEDEVNNVNKNKYDHRNYRRSFKENDQDIDANSYQEYAYIESDAINKTNEEFLGDYAKSNTESENNTKKNQMALYKSGWKMHLFLPNVVNIKNKLESYSHDDFFKKLSNEEKMIYIFDKFLQNHHISIKLPKTDEEKYPNLYSYRLWQNIKKEIKQNGSSETFNKLNKHLLQELPRQVWENPICYSYMIDREYGITKKLWWEIIPKQEWATVKFSKLDNNVLDKITPLKHTTTSNTNDDTKKNWKFIKEEY